MLEKFQLDDMNNNAFRESNFISIRKPGIKVPNLSKMDKKKLPYQKTLFDYNKKHAGKTSINSSHGESIYVFT